MHQVVRGASLYKHIHNGDLVSLIINIYGDQKTFSFSFLVGKSGGLGNHKKLMVADDISTNFIMFS